VGLSCGRTEDGMKRLLFLCTGNYYRSRYAEILFNFRAPLSGLSWRADSRGLDLIAGQDNVGPLSPFVVDRSNRRGLGVGPPDRMPRQVALADLHSADLVIALKQAEHEGMLLDSFPDWAHRVEYWHIDDTDRMHPDEALGLIESEVERLIERLRESR